MPWKPDPTFYPSPRSAAEAPPEELAYVVTLNTRADGDARPDALDVIDLKAGSSTYGTRVGRLDMPNVGDELHHFGWNACQHRSRMGRDVHRRGRVRTVHGVAGPLHDGVRDLPRIAGKIPNTG